MEPTKVVVVVLAIVAAVVAQAMYGEAILRKRKDRSITGFFKFNQASPSAKITIVGSVIEIPPRIYIVVVHDGSNDSINCRSLDLVREVNHNLPFRLFHLPVTNTGLLNTRWSFSTATLQPNRTNSICDSTIAIYRASKFYVSEGLANFRPIAYGYVFCDCPEL